MLVRHPSPQRRGENLQLPLILFNRVAYISMLAFHIAPSMTRPQPTLGEWLCEDMGRLGPLIALWSWSQEMQSYLICWCILGLGTEYTPSHESPMSSFYPSKSKKAPKTGCLAGKLEAIVGTWTKKSLPRPHSLSFISPPPGSCSASKNISRKLEIDPFPTHVWTV